MRFKRVILFCCYITLFGLSKVNAQSATVGTAHKTKPLQSDTKKQEIDNNTGKPHHINSIDETYQTTTLDKMAYNRNQKGLATKNSSNTQVSYSSYNIISIDDMMQRTQVQNHMNANSETKNLLMDLRQSLNKLSQDQLGNTKILKIIENYDMKLLNIIQKEQELNELLDYIQRLNGVASTRKDRPVKRKQVEIEGYRWPN